MKLNTWVIRWQNVVLIPPTNEDENDRFVEICKMLKIRRLNEVCRYETIKKMQAFIECIPSTMRGPMCVALTKLFKISYYWFNPKKIFFSDGTETLYKEFYISLSCFNKNLILRENSKNLKFKSGKIHIHNEKEKRCNVYPNLYEAIKALKINVTMNGDLMCCCSNKKCMKYYTEGYWQNNLARREIEYYFNNP